MKHVESKCKHKQKNSLIFEKTTGQKETRTKNETENIPRNKASNHQVSSDASSGKTSINFNDITQHEGMRL
jgi:hypothetical protein